MHFKDELKSQNVSLTKCSSVHVNRAPFLIFITLEKLILRSQRASKKVL